MSWSMSLRFVKDVKTDKWKTRDICDEWWKGEGWEFFFKNLDHYTQNIQKRVKVYTITCSHKIIFNWLMITKHSLYILIGLPRVRYNNWVFFQLFFPGTSSVWGLDKKKKRKGLGLLVYFISVSNFSATMCIVT